VLQSENPSFVGQGEFASEAIIRPGDEYQKGGRMHVLLARHLVVWTSAAISCGGIYLLLRFVT